MSTFELWWSKECHELWEFENGISSGVGTETAASMRLKRYLRSHRRSVTMSVDSILI